VLHPGQPGEEASTHAGAGGVGGGGGGGGVGEGRSGGQGPLVTKAHFERAIADLRPSLSVNERRRFERDREGGGERGRGGGGESERVY